MLSEGGLGPALRNLARRSAVPVDLELAAEDRLPEPVEVAAYYVVLVAGLAGGALLFRRGMRLPLAVLLVPVVLSSLTAVGTYGLVRLRNISEISLLVLAGAAVAYLTVRRTRSAPRHSAVA